MKKLLFVLIISLTGFSLAQSNIYAGASVGAGGLLSGFALPITGHVGFEDFYSRDLDMRLDLRFLLGSNTGFEFGVNGLYNFQVSRDLPLEVYVGGGGRVLFITDFLILGGGLNVGTDYYLSEQLSLFGELRLDSYLRGWITQFGIGAGAKFHF